MKPIIHNGLKDFKSYADILAHYNSLQRREQCANGWKWYRYKHMQLYISLAVTSGCRYVTSYDTEIGYINDNAHIFIEWGHGVHSRTTSAQITRLANDLKKMGYSVVHTPVPVRGFYIN